MTEPDLDHGFDTPEEAVIDQSLPPGAQAILGVRIEGDAAAVFSLWNDGPPFEEYMDWCVRRGGRWFGSHGSTGWTDPPDDVVAAARALGHT